MNARSEACRLRAHPLGRYVIAGVVGIAGLALGIAAAAITAHLMESSGSAIVLVIGTIAVTAIAVVTFSTMGRIILPRDRDGSDV